MGMVVNDEPGGSAGHVGRDINIIPKVREQVEKGTRRFRATSGVAWCNKHGLVEQA
jgi:hypothetical protein